MCGKTLVTSESECIIKSGGEIMSKLKYPVLLVHGMGFRDYKRISYWGRIPKVLENAGCQIFYGRQDSNGSIETNGEFLSKRIEEIIRETKAEKVNIIAHSKGGLDCRYAISKNDVGDKVASLTTISTPHHGSKTIDKLMKIPKPLIKFSCFVADLWFRLLGDKKPQTYKTICSFTTRSAEKFNLEIVNREEVCYQSYAFTMKKPTSDMLMWFTYIIVNKVEGDNDGLVTPTSAQWGNFKGVFQGSGNRGISHCDEVDLRRKPLSKIKGYGVSDITDIYLEIVNNLSEAGF